MRNDFLGDSLDMAKRALVSILSSHGWQVFVFPLPAENQFDFEMYERLLNVKASNNVKVMNKPPLAFRYPTRGNYFEWMMQSIRPLPSSNQSMILLDPDKGIDSNKQTCEFLAMSEVSELVAVNKRCVVGAYHHRNVGGFSCEQLLERLKPVHSFAYDFGAAAMCFMSQDNKRLAELKSRY